MSNGLCERVIPTIVTSPKTERFIAAYTRPCRVVAVATQIINPPTPGELAFEVDLCPFHNDEAITYEPLSEESIYTYCGECKSYADINGNCGCP